MRKGDNKLQESINKIIVPAFSTTILEANEDKKLKMNKVILPCKSETILGTLFYYLSFFNIPLIIIILFNALDLY